MEGKLKYNKKELLEIVKKNREKHAEDYAVARAGYQKKLIELLEKDLARAKAGKKGNGVMLQAPRKYLKDYDRTIKQLELTKAEEIELNDTDFSQLVMDEWRWKREFSASNAMYSSSFQDDEDEDDEEDE